MTAHSALDVVLDVVLDDPVVAECDSLVDGVVTLGAVAG
jgi:hypothetical protein